MQAERAAGQVVNVATGRGTSLNGLVEHLGTASGRVVEAEYAAPVPGDIWESTADVARASRVMGFEAGTPLAEGLKRVME